MKEFIKEQYKNILLVIGYISVALAVYITLSNSLGWPWWAALLISLGIISIGVVMGYFYIKGEMKPKEIVEEAKNDKE